MPERVRVINKGNGIVEVNSERLTTTLQERGLPLLDMVLNNRPTERKTSVTLGHNWKTNIVVYPNNILLDMEDFVFNAREILEGEKIERPKRRRARLTDFLYHRVYVPLEESHNEEKDMLGFAVSESRLNEYLQSAKNNFAEYGITLLPEKAKERAERTVTKLVGYNLERNIGAVTAHEYSHSSPDAVKLGEELMTKHELRNQLVLTGGLLAGGAVLSALHVPGILALVGGFSIGALGIVALTVAKDLIPFMKSNEKIAFDATSKKNIAAFAQAIKVDYNKLYSVLFPKNQ